MVSRLVGAPEWNRTRVCSGRHPELASQAAEDRLAALAGQADLDGEQEAAAIYRFHQALIRRCRTASADEAVASLRADELVPDLVAEGAAAYRHFTATGSQAGLASAVRHFERAAELAGSWHADRSAVLNNLGLALFERSASGGQQQGILTAPSRCLRTRSQRRARTLAGRSAALANLGTALLARRSPPDLERAAALGRGSATGRRQ